MLIRPTSAGVQPETLGLRYATEIGDCFGRLAPDATIDEARAEISVIGTRMAADRLPGFGWLLSHSGAPEPPCRAILSNIVAIARGS